MAGEGGALVEVADQVELQVAVLQLADGTPATMAVVTREVPPSSMGEPVPP